MVRAGEYSVQDNGFAVSNEQINGQTRQAFVMELPGGIDDTALAAICAGPVEVEDAEGNTAVYDGPFVLVSHSLKLMRADASDDVAVLARQVASLQVEAQNAVSAKESAEEELARLKERLESAVAGEGTGADGAPAVDSGEAQ